MTMGRTGRTRVAIGGSASAAAIALVIGGALPAGAAAVSAAPATAAVAAWGTTNSAPAGFRASLSGVAAATGTDAWTVGAYNPDQSSSQVLDQPYAEHWNGTAWAATPPPALSLFGRTQAAVLAGAAAVGPGQAWAVGEVSDTASLTSQTLAYHWTGQAWVRTASPNPNGTTGSNGLAAVAVRNASDVWAAGFSGFPETSLVEHWNGTAWSTVTVPNIGALQAVAVDSSHVWAEGVSSVERFDGTKWTALPNLPVQSGSTIQLSGLAVNGSNLWAVGTQVIPVFDHFNFFSYAAVFNGTSWTTVSVPGDGLSAAAVSGSSILATSPNHGVFRLTTAGPTTQEVTPAASVYPDAVTVDSSGRAWAVGPIHTTSGAESPGIFTDPGIGQGGILVTTGAAGATVTWTGPVTGSGTADVFGQFNVGGLPDGNYTVITTNGGCTPGVASVTVTAGIATPVNASVTC